MLWGMRDCLQLLRKNGDDVKKRAFCKQRMIVGFWWLKEEVTVSERILCSSAHFHPYYVVQAL